MVLEIIHQTASASVFMALLKPRRITYTSTYSYKNKQCPATLFFLSIEERKQKRVYLYFKILLIPSLNEEVQLHHSNWFKSHIQPWSGGSIGWSIILYTKRLGVQFLVKAHMGGNWLMFLSHIDVSLSLSLPSPPSKINKHIKK